VSARLDCTFSDSSLPVHSVYTQADAENIAQVNYKLSAGVGTNVNT